MSNPFFFFQAEDGIRDDLVTGVQTCALPISLSPAEPFKRLAAFLEHVKTHPAPMIARGSLLDLSHQLPVQPEREFAVSFLRRRIEFQHYFNALPAALRRERRRFRTQAVAPVFAVGRNLHFMPVRIECPCAL